MKKKYLLILLCIFLLGCGSDNNNTENNEENKPVATEIKENEEEIIEEEIKTYVGYPKGEVVKSGVLLEENGLKFELIKAVYDEDSLDVVIDLENLTGKTIKVYTNKVNVNGFNSESYVYNDIPDGGKARLYHEIFFYELENIGIKNVSEILLSYKIEDSKTFEIIDIAELIINTELPYEDPTKLASNTFSIVEGDGIYITGLGLEENLDELIFGMYIENRTEQRIVFQLEEFMVNGYAVNAYLYGDLPEDTGSFLNISMDKYQMERIDIKSVGDIENIKFIIYGQESEAYEEVFRTGRIKIDF